MLKRAGKFVTTLQFLMIQLRHQSGEPHVGMRADVSLSSAVVLSLTAR